VGSSGNEILRTAIPWAGYTHQGKEGYIRLTTLLFSEFEALEFEPRRYNDADDCVFVEGHFTFRHRQTGKIADSDWVARFDMQDGWIVGGQFYENTAGVAEARKVS
jgi:ketosteroid isomerase-like protein